LAEEEAHTQIVSAEPDPLLDEAESAQETESVDEHFTWSGPADWLDKEGEDWLFEKELTGAIIMPIEETNITHIELYNSGAIRHISPYKSDFLSYQTLSPPVYLNTVNQQHFPTVGTSTLAIHIPDEGTVSKLALHDALHALSVTYTLILLGALDEEGYHAHIRGGTMELVDSIGNRVGHIPCTWCCLYKVMHTDKSANATEVLSAMELHHRLGHIAVTSTCKLVESGAML
jgi:hypothetical protein